MRHYRAFNAVGNIGKQLRSTAVVIPVAIGTIYYGIRLVKGLRRFTRR